MKSHIISVETITELKAQPGSVDNCILTKGMATAGDGKGGLYYFDPADNDSAEDTKYYNVVVPVKGGGRWKKVFIRTLVLPHGTLVINGGKKEFFCAATTNANGDATINLTYDNTITGQAIFTDVWYDSSKGTVNTGTANDAVQGYRKSLAANFKTITHGFFRGNSTQISVLGLQLLSFRAAASATPVIFKIEGV